MDDHRDYYCKIFYDYKDTWVDNNDSDSEKSDNYREEDFDALLIKKVENYPYLHKNKTKQQTDISNA